MHLFFAPHRLLFPKCYDEVFPERASELGSFSYLVITAEFFELLRDPLIAFCHHGVIDERNVHFSDHLSTRLHAFESGGCCVHREIEEDIQIVSSGNAALA